MDDTVLIRLIPYRQTIPVKIIRNILGEEWIVWKKETKPAIPPFSATGLKIQMQKKGHQAIPCRSTQS
jgi:hypothetical protein